MGLMQTTAATYIVQQCRSMKPPQAREWLIGFCHQNQSAADDARSLLAQPNPPLPRKWLEAVLAEIDSQPKAGEPIVVEITSVFNGAMTVAFYQGTGRIGNGCLYFTPSTRQFLETLRRAGVQVLNYRD